RECQPICRWTPLDEKPRAADTRDDGRCQHQNGRRKMEIENLLHESHRGLERRSRDIHRCKGKHCGSHDKRRNKNAMHGNPRLWASGFGLWAYSVINGSNVHSDKVTKTTSKNTSSV